VLLGSAESIFPTLAPTVLGTIFFFFEKLVVETFGKIHRVKSWFFGHQFQVKISKAFGCPACTRSSGLYLIARLRQPYGVQPSSHEPFDLYVTTFASLL
jgi:hypothetical protein